MRGILRGLGTKPVPGGRTSRTGDDALSPIEMSDDQRRLQLLDDFEAAGIAWFWATDDQNRVVYLSPSAAEFFGVSHAELIGRPLASSPLAQFTFTNGVPCRNSPVTRSST